MKMKIPTNTSNMNGYGPHESSAVSYISDGSDNSHRDEIDSPTLDGDFSEYLWMENEEEFDKQVMQQLEEEALMEQCIEAMLEDERESHSNISQSPSDSNELRQTWSSIAATANGTDLCQHMESLRVQDQDEIAKQSTLNPDAAEFVPGQRSSAPLILAETS